MRPATKLVLVSAALAAFVSVPDGAFAHGGAYQGPAGEIPPNSRDPFDPPPPAEGGGPGTGGGDDGGPITGGGGDVGGPLTGGGSGGGVPTGGGGGVPETGGGTGPGPVTGGARSDDNADWIFWWNLNRDRLLGLRAHLAVTTSTGQAVHVFAGQTTRSHVVSATKAQIENDVIPLFAELLAQDDLHFDVRTAAALAIAKSGDTTQIPLLLRLARNADGKTHRVVEETAALALGVLGQPSEDVLGALVEIAADPDCRGAHTRAFAVVSIGLLGRVADGDLRAFARSALIDVVARDGTPADVAHTAILSLGNLDDDAAVAPLLAAFSTGRVAKGAAELPGTARSLVVDALGRLGRIGTPGDERAVLDALAPVLGTKRSRSVPVNVRRSAAIALAGLAVSADAETARDVAATLSRAIADDRDGSVRGFATISLGRMLAEANLDARTRQTVGAQLVRQMEKGQPAYLTRPFAALALGLAARGERAAGRAVLEDEILQPLRSAWKASEGSDPKVRGAYAIGIGLGRDVLGAPSLMQGLESGSERLRGHAALALGMLGVDDARQPVMELLANDASREVRLQTAMAAGLLGEAEAVPLLVEFLREKDSQYLLGSAALALGRIGDARAIGPLMEIVRNPKGTASELMRALAVVSLGQIADTRDVPALTEYLRDVNYRSVVGSPALYELLTIL